MAFLDQVNEWITILIVIRRGYDFLNSCSSFFLCRCEGILQYKADVAIALARHSRKHTELKQAPCVG